MTANELILLRTTIMGLEMTEPSDATDSASLDVAALNDMNLTALLDVTIDIEQEIQLLSGPVEIPLMPKGIKFATLMPVDSISARDSYRRIRGNAVEFLAKLGVINNVALIRASHRWEDRVRLNVEVDRLRNALNELRVFAGINWTNQASHGCGARVQFQSPWKSCGSKPMVAMLAAEIWTLGPVPPYLPASGPATTKPGPGDDH